MSQAKPWSDAITAMPVEAPDHRWAGPTEKCLCGGRLMCVVCQFDDGEIGSYMLDMKCLECGAVLTAPIPDGDS